MTSDTEETSKALVRRFVAAYVEGDFGAAFSLLDEDIVWSLNALPGHFRFGGRWESIARVREGLAMIAADYTVHRYEIIHMISENDTVWTTSKLSVTQRKTGRPLSFEIAARWKIRDSKITETTEYFDSAGVLNQQGDVPANVRVQVTG